MANCARGCRFGGGGRLISEVGLDISLSFRYAMPSARVHVRSTCSRPVSVLRTSPALQALVL